MQWVRLDFARIVNLANHRLSSLVLLGERSLQKLEALGGELDVVLVGVGFDGFEKSVVIRVRARAKLGGDAINDVRQRFFLRRVAGLLDSPWPASPVKSDEPLWTSAMRLPSGVRPVTGTILESLSTRNII
jgi:hypothetical protein